MSDFDKPLVKLTDARVLRRTVEQAGHAIMLVDTDGTIEYVNPAFERITGYTAAEAIGENPRLLNSGEHDKSFFADLWGTILSGEVWESELVNRRKDGSLMHVDHTIAPVTDYDGTIEKFVAVFTDVTEQKLERQQLQVLYRLLRHNLRNELNVVMGYGDAIRTETTDERVADYARAIEDACARLTRVSEKANTVHSTVNDVGSGTGCVDVVSTVAEQIDALRDACEHATISLTAPDGRAPVKVPVVIAIEELLENAIDHNDAETPVVDLTIERNERRDGNPFGPESWVAITVSDNGPGIPAQERATVRAGKETPLQHGSGLGLWLVSWITRQVGGKIDIETHDPRGTTVSVFVPESSSADASGGKSGRRIGVSD
ncbi:PAS domain S-box protein [Halorientalis brevis]|uniref:PAS domain S-box protein n=1 Tax=Halorientalis brevis TaxID=1126241 RepID=A0ABD6CAR7_9EURY|nr:PAS domain S-box protein [Halorientalis brevis]